MGREREVAVRGPWRLVGVAAALVVAADLGGLVAGVGHTSDHASAPAVVRTAPPTTAAAPPPSSASATLPASPTVTTTGPTDGEVDVLFTSPTVGFVLDAGAGAPNPRGYNQPDADQVQMTTDGGRTWRTVWQSAPARLEAVVRAGQSVIVTGDQLGPSNGIDDVSNPFVLTSSDSGATWTRHASPLPAAGGSVTWYGERLAFANGSDGVAVPDPETAHASGPGFRTSDGGATWTPIVLPDGYTASGGAAFTSAGTLVVTGTSGKAGSCLGEVFSSTDQGADWTAAPSSCTAYPLTSLSFPDANHGFAGGGYPEDGEDGGTRDLLTTADGGRTWAVRYQGGGKLDTLGGQFSELAFTDPTHGYALAAGCGSMAGMTCTGTLMATADGGTTWTPTGIQGLRLSAPSTGDVWAVTDGWLLQHSSDGTATFVADGQPGNVMIQTVRASGATVFIGSSAGDLLSHDGGRTWRTLTMSGLPAELRQSSPVAISDSGTMLFVDDNGTDPGGLWVSQDDGTTGRYVHTGLVADDFIVAGIDGDRLVEIGSAGSKARASEATSTDGGAHWTTQLATGLPEVEISDSTLVFAGSTQVLDGSEWGGFTSADGGRTWTSITKIGTTRGQVCPVSGGPGLIGYQCDIPGNVLDLQAPGRPGLDIVDLTDPDGSARDLAGYRSGSTFFAIGDPSHLWLTDGTHVWESTGSVTRWSAVQVPWALSG